jgi:gluconolactonase
MSNDVQLHDHEILAEGLRFPEGPVWCPDGSVMFVEIARPRLARVRPLGTGGWSSVETVAEIPGGPNGAALGPVGEVYICNNGGCFEWVERGPMLFPGPRPASYAGGSIQRVDPASGTVTTLYTTSTAADGSVVALCAPNDLVLDGHGGMWFTDHGTRGARVSDRTGIHYARLDGSACAEMVFPTESPNGIGLSPNGDTLYWAETHTSRIYARPIVEPGVLGKAGPNNGCIAGLPGFQLLDSLAVDAEGNVCVATLMRGGITVVAPSRASHHVALPESVTEPMTTNIAFGGPDFRTAFITQSGFGRLVAVPWPTAGLRLVGQQ